MRRERTDFDLIEPSLRRYLDAEVEPEFLSLDGKPIPKAMMREWNKQFASFGYICAPQPECIGGLGLDWIVQLQIFEEIGYTALDVAIPGFLNTIALELIKAHASDELKATYLPGLIDGSLFGAVGISEPNVGSDVASVSTKARSDGDDWIVSGEKTWITNGAFADFLICTCRTADNQLTHILIDREANGFEVQEIHKLALNGQSTSQIFLDEVRVPKANTVGELGAGLRNTLKVFEIARCHMAMWGVAIARRAMHEAVKYAQERNQHGKPLAAHQLIAEKIANMATHIDAARLLAMRGAELFGAGLRCDVECSMAKWFGTEMAVAVTRDAVQIFGGAGLLDNAVVGRLAKEALIAPIPDGTTEIQKLIIARAKTDISAIR